MLKTLLCVHSSHEKQCSLTSCFSWGHVWTHNYKITFYNTINTIIILAMTFKNGEDFIAQFIELSSVLV